MVGLFPVTGLKSKSDSTENIEFRPISFRLVATVLFIFAVILLEGVGLLHMLLFRYENVKKIWTVFICVTLYFVKSESFSRNFFSQREEPVYAHGNAIMNSNFAPVLHYGTTVKKKLNRDFFISRFFFQFFLGCKCHFAIKYGQKISKNG